MKERVHSQIERNQKAIEDAEQKISTGSLAQAETEDVQTDIAEKLGDLGEVLLKNSAIIDPQIYNNALSFLEDHVATYPHASVIIPEVKPVLEHHPGIAEYLLTRAIGTKQNEIANEALLQALIDADLNFSPEVSAKNEKSVEYYYAWLEEAQNKLEGVSTSLDTQSSEDRASDRDSLEMPEEGNFDSEENFNASLEDMLSDSSIVEVKHPASSDDNTLVSKIQNEIAEESISKLDLLIQQLVNEGLSETQKNEIESELNNELSVLRSYLEDFDFLTEDVSKKIKSVLAQNASENYDIGLYNSIVFSPDPSAVIQKHIETAQQNPQMIIDLLVEALDSDNKVLLKALVEADFEFDQADPVALECQGSLDDSREYLQNEIQESIDHFMQLEFDSYEEMAASNQFKDLQNLLGESRASKLLEQLEEQVARQSNQTSLDVLAARRSSRQSGSEDRESLDMSGRELEDNGNRRRSTELGEDFYLDNMNGFESEENNDQSTVLDNLAADIFSSETPEEIIQNHIETLQKNPQIVMELMDASVENDHNSLLRALSDANLEFDQADEAGRACQEALDQWKAHFQNAELEGQTMEQQEPAEPRIQSKPKARQELPAAVIAQREALADQRWNEITNISDITKVGEKLEEYIDQLKYRLAVEVKNSPQERASELEDRVKLLEAAAKQSDFYEKIMRLLPKEREELVKNISAQKNPEVRRIFEAAISKAHVNLEQLVAELKKREALADQRWNEITNISDITKVGEKLEEYIDELKYKLAVEVKTSAEERASELEDRMKLLEAAAARSDFYKKYMLLSPEATEELEDIIASHKSPEVRRIFAAAIQREQIILGVFNGNNDPFEVTPENNIQRVKYAYDLFSDFGPKDVATLMVNYPQMADVFLKKRTAQEIKQGGVAAGNFRAELVNSGALLEYINNDFIKNPNLLQKIIRANLSSEITAAAHKALKFHGHDEYFKPLMELFTDKISDPFRVARGNGVEAARNAYKIASRYTTEEIIEFMKRNPEKADAFLKARSKMALGLLGGHNFRSEIESNTKLTEDIRRGEISVDLLRKLVAADLQRGVGYRADEGYRVQAIKDFLDASKEAGIPDPFEKSTDNTSAKIKAAYKFIEKFNMGEIFWVMNRWPDTADIFLKHSYFIEKLLQNRNVVDAIAGKVILKEKMEKYFSNEFNLEILLKLAQEFPDPYVIKANNNKVKDIPIKDIIEFIKLYPEHADVFLKSRSKLSLTVSGSRDFRTEIASSVECLAEIARGNFPEDLLERIAAADLPGAVGQRSKEEYQKIIESKKSENPEPEVQSGSDANMEILLELAQKFSDPYINKSNNNKVKDIPIKDIIEFIKLYPEHADVFLKTRSKLSLKILGGRDFRNEIARNGEFATEIRDGDIPLELLRRIVDAKLPTFVGDRARDRYQEIMQSGKSEATKASVEAQQVESRNISSHPAYAEAQKMSVGELMKELNRLNRELNRARHVDDVLSEEQKTELRETIRAYTAVIRKKTNTDPVRVSATRGVESARRVYEKFKDMDLSDVVKDYVLRDPDMARWMLKERTDSEKQQIGEEYFRDFRQEIINDENEILLFNIRNGIFEDHETKPIDEKVLRVIVEANLSESITEAAQTELDKLNPPEIKANELIDSEERRPWSELQEIVDFIEASQKAGIPDPFEKSAYNNSFKIKAAYKFIEKFNIGEILEVMKVWTDYADIFLKHPYFLDKLSQNPAVMAEMGRQFNLEDKMKKYFSDQHNLEILLDLAKEFEDPYSKKSCCEKVKDIPIKDVIKFMKQNPEYADAFLKERNSAESAVLGRRDFRQEIAGDNNFIKDIKNDNVSFELMVKLRAANLPGLIKSSLDDALGKKFPQYDQLDLKLKDEKLKEELKIRLCRNIQMGLPLPEADTVQKYIDFLNGPQTKYAGYMQTLQRDDDKAALSLFNMSKDRFDSTHKAVRSVNERYSGRQKLQQEELSGSKEKKSGIQSIPIFEKVRRVLKR